MRGDSEDTATTAKTEDGQTLKNPVSKANVYNEGNTKEKANDIGAKADAGVYEVPVSLSSLLGKNIKLYLTRRREYHGRDEE